MILFKRRVSVMACLLLALSLMTANASELKDGLSTGQPALSFSGSESNDIYALLKENGLPVKRYESYEAAIAGAPSGGGVLITAPDYPRSGIAVTEKVLQEARRKKLRLYLEYPSSLPGVDITPRAFSGRLERGVVTAGVFGSRLTPMSILGINDCHVYPVVVKDPLVVLAKVAGFDKAEYGLSGVDVYPILFRRDNMLVAMTDLSGFVTGRYAPEASWRSVWEYILGWLTGNGSLKIDKWASDVSPMYGRDEKLPADAVRNAVARGAAWFYKGRFLVHPDWAERPYTHMRNYLQPESESGPPPEPELPMGDGTLGIMEGHNSTIYYDGREKYRYWIRYDVQGESAFALAAAGKLLGKTEYQKTAVRLGDFLFHNPFMLSSARGDTASNLYGLIGWALFKPQVDVFYGDDNARALLGMIGASACLGTDRWNKEIVEGILGNFRTTGKHGFRGDRLEARQIDTVGWKHFRDLDLVNPHPHFESWMWACYLWLYDKTGYKPLLEKTKEAIRLTMEAYPDKWSWTNGIQQERARMILPLAWLVRVENTEEHREWLDRVVKRLLENQDASGGIREELGRGDKGLFGRTASNQDYGLYEAPLIFRNGDPVADMLYTSNFAFFSLNEAAHATGNPVYQEAVAKLANFLTRIQVRSDKHADVDGAWFRGFDFGRWDYWGSNADVGWGVWATLTGWIQSWIVATETLVQERKSYWEVTKGSAINEQMPGIRDIMFREK